MLSSQTSQHLKKHTSSETLQETSCIIWKATQRIWFRKRLTIIQNVSDELIFKKRYIEGGYIETQHPIADSLPCMRRIEHQLNCLLKCSYPFVAIRILFHYKVALPQGNIVCWIKLLARVSDNYCFGITLSDLVDYMSTLEYASKGSANAAYVA